VTVLGAGLQDQRAEDAHRLAIGERRQRLAADAEDEIVEQRPAQRRRLRAVDRMVEIDALDRRRHVIAELRESGLHGRSSLIAVLR
jgi:hypothetical protein